MASIAQLTGANRIRQTLRHRNFRIYVTGNSVSLVGTWMQRVAVGWFAWQMTGSEFWLGMVAFADLFPAVLLGPIGGVIADRYDRRTLLLGCTVAALLQALLLCALTAAGGMTIGLLVGLALLNGVINGIYHPVRLSIMPSLLPRSDLPNAIAINSVLFNFASFLGPAVAGVLIVTIGLVGAFAVNALSYLAFIASLLMIDFSKIAPPRNNLSERSGIVQQMKDGLVYTVAHPAIGPMLLLMFVIALTLRPVVEMMPAFAADVFQGKADVLAMLTSSVGIGAMIAGLTMAGRAADRLVFVILVAAAGMAVSVVLFVLSPYLALALVFAACAGAAMIASGISMQILMQMSVTDDMRGRVLGLYSIIFFGGPAAGALIMGTLAELMGLQLPFFAGAALVLLATLALRNRHEQIQSAVGTVLDAPE